MNVALQLSDDALEAIAVRAAEILAERETVALSPYLNTEEAAAYLRAKPHRIHDLVSRGVLTVLKDGSRNLYRREDLDKLLVEEARR